MFFQLCLLVFILHIFKNKLLAKNKYNIQSSPLTNGKLKELFILYGVKIEIYNTKST